MRAPDPLSRLATEGADRARTAARRTSETVRQMGVGARRLTGAAREQARGPAGELRTAVGGVLRDLPGAVVDTLLQGGDDHSPRNPPEPAARRPAREVPRSR
ncbi:hypothetical protein GCM10028777_15760 [Angustibacter speluncae]